MSIDGIGSRQVGQTPSATEQNSQATSGGGFGQVLSRAADGALRGVAAVAPAFPGGQLVSMAANGLRELRSAAPQALTAGQGQDDQVHQMFEMQKQSQAFNLQYLQLQTELQDDNRKFSTLTNLMKVRHDTVKAAINNMHA